MLKVQEYLQKNSLEQLVKDYAIKVVHSPIGEPLVILNYCQIDSPKYSPITRECRGLVLDTTDWSVVAKPFSRFFNYGESREETNKFNWDKFFVQDKEDGSLIILYNYKGSWRVNTRGSFGLGKVGESNFTWEELFYQTIDEKDLDCLEENYTFVFELCTLFNKVVRSYPVAKSFLLSVFENSSCEELKQERVAQLARIFDWDAPSLHTFGSVEEIIGYLEDSKLEATFEGFVLADNNGNRIKIKNKNYLLLHRAKNNSKDGSYDKKYIIPLILKGELDEIKSIFSELKEEVDYYKSKIDEYYYSTYEVYQSLKHIESQKLFAKHVMNSTELSFICFDTRKNNGDFKKTWNSNSEKLSKYLISKIQTYNTITV